jgi:hypothetical protein
MTKGRYDLISCMKNCPVFLIVRDSFLLSIQGLALTLQIEHIGLK